MAVNLDTYNASFAGEQLTEPRDPVIGEGADTLVDGLPPIHLDGFDTDTLLAARGIVEGVESNATERAEGLHQFYENFVLLEPPSRLLLLAHGPDMQDPEKLATAWMAHTVRAEAHTYERGNAYKQDVKDHAAFSKFVEQRLGEGFFEHALKATAKNKCTPADLGPVLTELHPVLQKEYGYYGPRLRDRLPLARGGTSVGVTLARKAVRSLAKKLFPGTQLPDGGNIWDRVSFRAVAEAELYRQTEVAGAPEAIQMARRARLATAFAWQDVVPDIHEQLTPQILKALPLSVREIYQEVDQHVPQSRRRWF